MDDKDLIHFGVTGMRWGVRRGKLYRKETGFGKKRQAKIDRWELNKLQNMKGYRSPHKKKLDAQKIAILKERIAKVEKTKMPQTPKKEWTKGQKVVAGVLIGIGALKVIDIVAANLVLKNL